MTREIIEAEFEQTEEIASISNAVILERSYVVSGIEPKVSVVQPHVKMVDVNLAYKLADLQSDASYLIGFATLFLGTCISAVVGLTLSATNSPANQTEIAVHFAIFIITLFVAVIFGLLARKAMQKATKAREELDTKMTEIADLR